MFQFSFGGIEWGEQEPDSNVLSDVAGPLRGISDATDYRPKGNITDSKDIWEHEKGNWGLKEIHRAS